MTDDDEFHFEIPPMNQLSENEFKAIDLIHKRNKKKICDLKKQIIDQIPRLRFTMPDEIDRMYHNYFTEHRNISFDFIKIMEKPGKRLQLKEMINSPYKYLKDNCLPFFSSRADEKYKYWSEEENNFLAEVMNESIEMPNFSILSLCFPGRTGREVYQHFAMLAKKGQIFDPRTLDVGKVPILAPYYRRIFLPNAEKALAESLLETSAKGIQVGKKMIIERAESFFKIPWILAERITYKILSSKQLPVYCDENEQKYTDLFKQTALPIEKKLTENLKINDDDQEVDLNEIKKILEQYKIPLPRFSLHWLRDFMRRNRISWRKAHYARRGAIDLTYAEIFLEQVAYAVIKYGWERVFNMDETAVRVNNGSVLTIGKIGTLDISVDGKRDDRECFTAIATCTKEKTYPLILLNKGEHSKRFEPILRAGDGTLVWNTGTNNGWVNENVMLDYLDHIHELSEHFPCALVVDCFKAHKTPKVIQKACDLGIELIIVPANGTGKYQPLDRKIFGILKAKLRALAANQIFEGKERFDKVCNHLIKAWSEITPLHLLRAWDIPGLFHKIDLLQKKEQPFYVYVDLEKFENEEEDIIEVPDNYHYDDGTKTSDDEENDGEYTELPDA